MKEEIILIGGGEHCESCIDVIESGNKYYITGIIDLPEKLDKMVMGYKIIGNDDDISKLSKNCKNFLITVGHVKDPVPRIRIYEKLKQLDVNLPIIISPLAYISQYAKVGEGCIIMHKSIIDVNAVIGNNCIVNHSTVIGHYAKIEDHCHVSANCVLGRCQIQVGTFIGGNSWVNNGVTIASHCIIGSGSNVIRSIEIEKSIVVGNPAKRIS